MTTAAPVSEVQVDEENISKKRKEAGTHESFTLVDSSTVEAATENLEVDTDRPQKIQKT